MNTAVLYPFWTENVLFQRMVPIQFSGTLKGDNTFNAFIYYSGSDFKIFD